MADGLTLEGGRQLVIGGEDVRPWHQTSWLPWGRIQGDGTGGRGWHRVTYDCKG